MKAIFKSKEKTSIISANMDDFIPQNNLTEIQNHNVAMRIFAKQMALKATENDMFLVKIVSNKRIK